jgi:Cu2+-exporting ATPase
MTCDHCKSSVENELDQLAGVTGRTVDVSSNTVVVEGTASEAAVTKAIEDAGYEVERVEGAGSTGGHPGPIV